MRRAWLAAIGAGCVLAAGVAFFVYDGTWTRSSTFEETGAVVRREPPPNSRPSPPGSDLGAAPHGVRGAAPHQDPATGTPGLPNALADLQALLRSGSDVRGLPAALHSLTLALAGAPSEETGRVKTLIRNPQGDAQERAFLLMALAAACPPAAAEIGAELLPNPEEVPGVQFAALLALSTGSDEPQSSVEFWSEVLGSMGVRKFIDARYGGAIGEAAAPADGEWVPVDGHDAMVRQRFPGVRENHSAVVLQAVTSTLPDAVAMEGYFLLTGWPAQPVPDRFDAIRQIVQARRDAPLTWRAAVLGLTDTGNDEAVARMLLQELDAAGQTKWKHALLLRRLAALHDDSYLVALLGGSTPAISPEEVIAAIVRRPGPRRMGIVVRAIAGEWGEPGALLVVREPLPQASDSERRAILDAARAWLDDDREARRIAAIRAMAAYGGAECLPALLLSAETARSPTTATEARRAVAFLKLRLGAPPARETDH